MLKYILFKYIEFSERLLFKKLQTKTQLEHFNIFVII